MFKGRCLEASRGFPVCFVSLVDGSLSCDEDCSSRHLYTLCNLSSSLGHQQPIRLPQTRGSSISKPKLIPSCVRRAVLVIFLQLPFWLSNHRVLMKGCQSTIRSGPVNVKCVCSGSSWVTSLASCVACSGFVPDHQIRSESAYAVWELSIPVLITSFLSNA